MLTVVPRLTAHGDPESNDYREVLASAQDALAHNDLPKAARNFQKAVDLNPSSAEAHQGLGAALLRELQAGQCGTSRETDIADRAEDHLKQAAQLAPSSAAPLLDVADLEALVAQQSSDPDEKDSRYGDARHALKQAIALQPDAANLYLKLAEVERDEFGPAVDSAKAQFPKLNGPIPDDALRSRLQQRFGPVIDDAIRNAQRASELNGNSQHPLLLLSKIYRERALLRSTGEKYAADIRASADWERQFLAVGGHTGDQ